MVETGPKSNLILFFHVSFAHSPSSTYTVHLCAILCPNSSYLLCKGAKRNPKLPKIAQSWLFGGHFAIFATFGKLFLHAATCSYPADTLYCLFCYFLPLFATFCYFLLLFATFCYFCYFLLLFGNLFVLTVTCGYLAATLRCLLCSFLLLFATFCYFLLLFATFCYFLLLLLLFATFRYFLLLFPTVTCVAGPKVVYS